MERHVIFGASGPIGSALADELVRSGKTVVKVGRRKLQEADYQSADALDLNQVLTVTQEASHIYITIGLAYEAKTWQRDWPVIIENMIEAAKVHNSRLIFFDNIYLYGPTLQDPIKEDHPIGPKSKKGQVRQQLFNRLEEAMNDIPVLIVRSPDFFGPKSEQNSVLHIQFLENLMNGKPAIFVGKPGKKHSYAYVADLGRAIQVLALDNSAYQQVWHLPAYHTDSITDILDKFNEQLGTDLGIRPFGAGMHRIISWFNPMMRELYEMRYQFDEDYVYNWFKFKQNYPEFRQTPLDDAIRETITAY